MSINLNLPDIASKQSAATSLPLKWVGMEQIAVPIEVPISDFKTQHTTAKADVFVSLDQPEAKGIHMSRLYIRLKNTLSTRPFSSEVLAELLKDLVESQQGLSYSARLQLQFELNLRKPALQSEEFGYQSYPVSLCCEYINGQMTAELSLTISYSSTCPCSAALSRQALGDAIKQQFGEDSISRDALVEWITSEQGSIATPHSQRSYAYIKLNLRQGFIPVISTLIAELEQVLGTPVQTAVKREDEQAFARLNAENLMFCEDAGRRLKQALEANTLFSDYWFKVEHQESLHAHNAVVIDQKFPQNMANV
ncbi:MAG: GTP cyclohydrolase FolE2 [Aestuariibacter sp.]